MHGEGTSACAGASLDRAEQVQTVPTGASTRGGGGGSYERVAGGKGGGGRGVVWLNTSLQSPPLLPRPPGVLGWVGYVVMILPQVHLKRVVERESE